MEGPMRAFLYQQQLLPSGRSILAARCIFALSARMGLVLLLEQQLCMAQLLAQLLEQQLCMAQLLAQLLEQQLCMA
jgi:hypothetical protein